MELLSRQRREISDVSENEIRDFLFNDQGVLARSEYSKILQIWWQAFGRRSVFVGLLDEVKSDPITLTKKVFQFLEVDEIYGIEEAAKKIVHKGKKESIPASLPERLCEYYITEITELNSLLPDKNISDKWLTTSK